LPTLTSEPLAQGFSDRFCALLTQLLSAGGIEFELPRLARLDSHLSLSNSAVPSVYKNISKAERRAKAPTATASATGSSMKIATAAANTGIGPPSCTICLTVPE